jgi:hypothetical protein
VLCDRSRIVWCPILKYKIDQNHLRALQVSFRDIIWYADLRIGDVRESKGRGLCFV